jgi:hypothetical protein
MDEHGEKSVTLIGLVDITCIGSETQDVLMNDNIPSACKFKFAMGNCVFDCFDILFFTAVSGKFLPFLGQNLHEKHIFCDVQGATAPLISP